MRLRSLNKRAKRNAGGWAPPPRSGRKQRGGRRGSVNPTKSGSAFALSAEQEPEADGYPELTTITQASAPVILRPEFGRQFWHPLAACRLDAQIQSLTT